MAIAVQFFGIDNVVSMAEKRSCPRWAIFNGRQFLFKFEGDSQEESSELLQKILEALEESQTDAIYTIKFYEDTSGKIKENTPCDGSFNFKITDPATREEKKQSMILGTTRNNERIDRMEAMMENILQRMNEPEDDTEPEPDPQSMNGILLGFLKEPDKIVQMIGAVKQIFGGAKAVQAIGNIPAVVPESSEEDKKILQAVDLLKKHDPKLGDHLLKLAAIAQTDPGAWKFLISTLESK